MPTQPNILEMLRAQIPLSQGVVTASTVLIAALNDLTPEDIRREPARFLQISREQVAHARQQAEQFIALAGIYDALVATAREEGMRDGGTTAIAGMLSALPKPATRLQDAVRGAILCSPDLGSKDLPRPRGPGPN